MLKIIVIYVLYNIIANSGMISGGNSVTEDVIRKRLLTVYDRTLSPLLYATVNDFTVLNFIVFRIQGLDEKKGEFITEGLILHMWSDERLLWEDDTIKKIRIPEKDIWVPTLHVYNSIEEPEVTLDTVTVAVKGTIWWVPRYILRTACNPNLRYFPFETQACKIIMSAISKEGDILPTNFSYSDVTTRVYINTGIMIENPQWSKESIKVEFEDMEVDSDTIRKVVIFTFTIRRSMPLIPLGILTPCLTCTLLLLTTFWMQAGTTLRTGIGVTSMLVSSSSLFTLGKILPASGSSTPILVEYVSITLILSTISSIQTMLTSILRRCEKLPPVSYTTIISKIPPVFLCLMGMSPEPMLIQSLDQKFLFSELEDPEIPADYERDGATPKPTENNQLQSIECLWIKYIVLLDRVMFYVIGIIILLFVISVIVTE